MKIASATQAAVAGLSLLRGHVVAAEIAAGKSAVDHILNIAPTASSCDPNQTECTTAQDAAGPLVFAMHHYGIMDAAAIAAILTTIAQESGDLKYKRNHYPPPGRPGQGSSNMQNYRFNYEFALETDRLKDQLAAIDGAHPDSNPSNETMNAVLDLIISNTTYNFMTGPWYYNKYCSDEIKAGFRSQADLDATFKHYQNDCIGVVPIEESRMDKWAKARESFGLP